MNEGTATRLSRRQIVAGAGIALASLQLPAARAQAPPEIAPDGFRLLPIRPISPVGTLRSRDRPPPLPWGYYGTTPGPTLRLRHGEELRVRLVNGMNEPTTVHWHGVRVPNAVEGAPLGQEPIKGGASFDYRFTPPDAGTFWYHANPAQTEMGLAGLLIVDEREPVDVAHDHALMFQNVSRFGLEFPISVAEPTRLRLVNAGARLIRIQISEASPAELRVWVMAIDGQPAEPFLAHGNRVSLVPGNRVDVFVETTLEPGTKVPIMVEPKLVSMPPAHLVLEGPARYTPLASPKALPANPLPPRLDLARAQRVNVPIQAAFPAVPRAALFSVRRGRVVVLAFANRTDVAQVLHLHGHSARLLDRLDDGWKPFWLDTLLVEARQTERIAFLADNPGKWAIDLQALERDGTGILGWFEVT